MDLRGIKRKKFYNEREIPHQVRNDKRKRDVCHAGRFDLVSQSQREGKEDDSLISFLSHHRTRIVRSTYSPSSDSARISCVPDFGSQKTDSPLPISSPSIKKVAGILAVICIF